MNTEWVLHTKLYFGLASQKDEFLCFTEERILMGDFFRCVSVESSILDIVKIVKYLLLLLGTTYRLGSELINIIAKIGSLT